MTLIQARSNIPLRTMADGGLAFPLVFMFRLWARAVIRNAASTDRKPHTAKESCRYDSNSVYVAAVYFS